MPLAEAAAACTQRVVGWDWGAEAIPEPAFAVRVGPSVVVAVLTDTLPTARIYRLVTYSTAARTSVGAHVGMSIDSLVTLYGAVTFDEYECGLFANFASLKHMGFALTLPSSPAPDCGSLVPKKGRLPISSRVSRIQIAQSEPIK